MTGQIVKSIPYLLIAFLFFPNFAFGESAQFGYRVTQAGKTVIQIARDVYNDERQWKKIAYWNNLTPPYALSVGQVLVLPMPPKLQVAEKNLVTGADVPAPQFAPALPSVSRVILNRKGYCVYEVNERAPSLSMVALENYGDKNMIKIIARWNGLAANDRLSLGQKLILHEKPKLTAAQSNKVLIKEWARVGNPAMVQRISGFVPSASYQPTAQTPLVAPASVGHKPASIVTAQENTTQDLPKPPNASEVPVETIAPAKVVEPAATPMPAVENPIGAAPTVPAVPSASLPSLPATPSVSLPSLPAVPGGSLPSLPSVPSSTSSGSEPNATEPTVTKPAAQSVEEPAAPQGSHQLPQKKVQSVVTEPATLGQPLNVMETQTPNVFQPSDDPELQSQPAQAVQQPVYQEVAPTAPVQAPQPQQTYQQPVQQPAQQAVQQAPQVTVPTPESAAPVAPVQTAQPAVQPPAPTAPAPEEPKREVASTPTDPLQQPEPTSDSYWLGSDTVRIMKNLSKPSK